MTPCEAADATARALGAIGRGILNMEGRKPMLVLSQEIVKQQNGPDAEVIIDLREFGLGLVVVAPLDLRGKGKVRIGYEADPQVKIYRRRIFEQIERAA
jgi:hypothetical protein